MLGKLGHKYLVLCLSSKISDLALSLSYRHIAIYIAHIVYTILGRMCFLRDFHFAVLYFVVSQQFDKHLDLTSCLNAHNHNTCVHLPQNRLYCVKDGILHY